jgi:uncharacterized protein YciI
MLRRAILGFLGSLPLVRHAAAAPAAATPAPVLAAGTKPAAAPAAPQPRQLFVLMHRPGLHWDRTKSFSNQPGIGDHVAYMKAFFVTGRLLAGGPFLDNSGGMMVFHVQSETAAAQIAAGDPAVQRGLLQVTVRPWLDVFVR